MNPNDDRDKKQSQKEIDKGNEASKRNEAKRRLIAKHGEAILEDKNLEKLISEEVKVMDDLASIPEPTVRGHNVHKSILNSPDNDSTGKAEAGVGRVPGQATAAQNTQNQNIAPKKSEVPKDKTDIIADRQPDTGDQVKRQDAAVHKN